MRLYSRPWDETAPDHPHWGTSHWFFETDAEGEVVRQVEEYNGGQVLRYDVDHIEDGFGRLAEKPLDLAEFERFAITEEDFLRAWPAGTPAGPTGNLT